MRFEQLLHETIDEMTGELRGPGAGLAARSIAKGRSIRRTRRLAVAGGAVMATVVIALPWLVLPRADHAAPVLPGTSTTPTTGTTNELPGGWVVTRVGSSVLDRATGEYVTMSGQVSPAPAGNRVLVVDGPGSVRLVDVRGTHPVTVDTTGFVGDFNWSSAGDRLVGGITQKDPDRVGFAVIDAETGAVRRHWIDHGRYDCSQCTFTWTRDGGAVVLPIADRSGGEAAELVDSLQSFDATTGEPGGSLMVTAMPAGPLSWSPGGRYVVAGPPTPGAAEGWRLYDITTGQSADFPAPAVWVSADLLLATRDGKVLTLTPDGTVTATMQVSGAGRATIGLGPPG
ncbi:hypothetical protein [Dactylosporangium sp. NPDC005555]|uniref:hypothetical protein n=1 Tax=Dactylosporangium sp. NPDC005555 TaxID=3154889 RepID=UPI0033A84587